MFDFRKFFANVRGAAKVAPAAMQATMQYAAVVIKDAQALCPVAEKEEAGKVPGFLKASGMWEPAVEQGNTIICVFGFNCSYAAFVHEDLEAHHKQGQAKFLEAAMAADAAGFGPFVGNAVKG